MNELSSLAPAGSRPEDKRAARRSLSQSTISRLPAMTTDIQIYCDNMAVVKTRIEVVQGILSGHITTGKDDCNTELIFLQLRKTLELIAFSSLSANKTAYSAVHKKFASHWRAKAMLDALEKVNPDYYPLPLDAPQEVAPGKKHFPRLTDGYMTKEDFISLYDFMQRGASHAESVFYQRSDDSNRIPCRNGLLAFNGYLVGT